MLLQVAGDYISGEATRCDMREGGVGQSNFTHSQVVFSCYKDEVSDTYRLCKGVLGSNKKYVVTDNHQLCRGFRAKLGHFENNTLPS